MDWKIVLPFFYFVIPVVTKVFFFVNNSNKFSMCSGLVYVNIEFFLCVKLGYAGNVFSVLLSVKHTLNAYLYFVRYLISARKLYYSK